MNISIELILHTCIDKENKKHEKQHTQNECHCQAGFLPHILQISTVFLCFIGWPHLRSSHDNIRGQEGML